MPFFELLYVLLSTGEFGVFVYDGFGRFSLDSSSGLAMEDDDCWFTASGYQMICSRDQQAIPFLEPSCGKQVPLPRGFQLGDEMKKNALNSQGQTKVTLLACSMLRKDRNNWSSNPLKSHLKHLKTHLTSLVGARLFLVFAEGDVLANPNFSNGSTNFTACY